MIRIAGINLPDEKRIEIALTYVFGIGPSTSRKLLKLLEIDMTTRTKDLSAEDAGGGGGGGNRKLSRKSTSKRTSSERSANKDQ